MGRHHGFPSRWANRQEQTYADIPVDQEQHRIVDVLSPNTRERDPGAKAHCYARFAVGEYWDVGRRRSVCQTTSSREWSRCERHERIQ